MRRLSVSKWVLLCLIFTLVCGAQTGIESKVSSDNEDQLLYQSDSNLESNTENSTEGDVLNSDDATGSNSQDTQKSEDSEKQPEDTVERSEQQSQDLGSTVTTFKPTPSDSDDDESEFFDALDDPKTSFPQPTIFKTVHLDLDVSRDTYDFYYTKDVPWSTYTPKLGRVFDKVEISVPYVSPMLIWEPKLPSECSTKVKVFSTDSMMLFIDISILGGGRKVFGRRPMGTWRDITFPPDLKLYTLDKDGKEVELDPSNYTLKLDIGYKSEYTFDFKSDANCTEIRFKNDIVWKYNYTYCISGGLYKISTLHPTSIKYTIRLFLGEFNLTYSETHRFKVFFSDGSYSDFFIGDKHWDQVNDQS
ncbi:hypothetical protein TpMuguga_02g00819 [Theileria parva strain Muguga]|uniref:Uncharacterized protein n=1 Tax=Theileria parva TaxID=5875 RepID=Q4N419_THEPA|nr:uncharacterized protein TpMuguga_02g00819 [Theileria parva strain Muguga]EAN33104.1 hypothetical protein TpMuguga_02g00819 [Theileria parva strain Muguga]|eukprot:XP_765387.1 hypothetical protein [Theileria parva strain Muguga]